MPAIALIRLVEISNLDAQEPTTRKPILVGFERPQNALGLRRPVGGGRTTSACVPNTARFSGLLSPLPKWLGRLCEISDVRNGDPPMRRALTPLFAMALTISGAAGAQETQAQRPPSHCIAFVENTPGLDVFPVALTPRPVPANYQNAVPPDTIRISYIDHAMFLIQTPGGLSVVTDYNGYIGPTDFVPDIVTMNHAHGTHWTAAPDTRIPHVLPGWNADGSGPIEHELDLGEMLVRNVTTDIRGRFGGPPEADGNSIFIFEAEGLCIGHLGHLHHTPTPEQYAAIGRLDVVMAPVDGGMTLPLPDMIAVLKRVRAAVVIPSHWFSTGSLGVFVAGMEDQFSVDVKSEPYIEVSLRELPRRPTIAVLPPLMLGIDSP